jgi:hypothetical protein
MEDVRSVSTVLRYVGSTVTLGKMVNAPQHNGKSYYCYGIKLLGDEVKLVLRMHSAQGPCTYNGKYVMVKLDKVTKVREHPRACAILTNPIAIKAIYATGLDPSTIVAPEYLVNIDFCNGYQAYNNEYHARMHGLKPVLGYILGWQPQGGFTRNWEQLFLPPRLTARSVPR